MLRPILDVLVIDGAPSLLLFFCLVSLGDKWWGVVGTELRTTMVVWLGTCSARLQPLYDFFSGDVYGFQNSRTVCIGPSNSE